MNRFIIQGEYCEDTDDDLFWSNEMGWVDKDYATIFKTEELPELNMPIGAMFISYINFEDTIIETKPIYS